MGLFSNLKLYYSYKKIIRRNKLKLKSDFGIKVDRANRMYTVINVPEELYGEPYNIRKGDIDTISQTYLQEYVRGLSTYLDSIGVQELYDFYEPISKVGKYSYLVIIGFKGFNSVNYTKFLWYFAVPILIVTGLISLILIR